MKRSEVLQAVVELLLAGPKTREEIVRELAYLVPFEKALRARETRRVSLSKRVRRTDGKPTERAIDFDKKVQIGKTAVVSKRIDDAVSYGIITRGEGGYLFLTNPDVERERMLALRRNPDGR